MKSRPFQPRSLLTLAAAFLLLIPSVPAAQPASAIESLLKDYDDGYKALHPLIATTTGDRRFNNRFPPPMAETLLKRELHFIHQFEKRIAKINRSTLSSDELLSLDILHYELEASARMTPDFFIIGDEPALRVMPLEQFDGFHTLFAQYGSGKGRQPFETLRDYNDWLARIHDLPKVVESSIEQMRKGSATGFTQPRVLMERVAMQLQELLTPTLANSTFLDPVKNFPATIPQQDRAHLASAYQRAVRSTLLPAYQRLLDFIRTEYIPKCRNTSGIWDIPRGTELYQNLVRYWTTTSMTPDQIHDLGLSEVSRIRGEMQKVMADTGFNGSLAAFFDYLRTDKKFMPYHSKEDVLNAYRAIETRLKPNLSKTFGLVPKAAFEIRATEPFREKTAAAEYSQPPFDLSRPGVFYIPIPDPAAFNSSRNESLFLHEAIPGHHYQVGIQIEQPGIPLFRKSLWYGAYGEGWALYTESLGRELGLYEDPIQYFGMLSAEMHRAIRLVVDTGMHWKKWTREQAIKYSLENEGLAEAAVTAEVERYMAIPGQALSYKIGQLKILELRRKAEKELGAKFDIRGYHDEVLRYGCLPLSMLEEKINRWIESHR